MNIHWLQHVEFEGPGCIGNWAGIHGHEITRTRLYADEELPDPLQIDMLVIMGGPMGVYDEQVYPWLNHEKAFIDRCIAQSMPVLGICLGAQLVADILGAHIYRNKYKEIGWHMIELTSEARKHRIAENLPASMSVFQWHGDTFDIPVNSVHLASSAACGNQAFLYKGSVLGLQFHFESTPESVAQLVANCRHELVPGEPYIQPEDRILNQTQNYDEINGYMNDVLTYLVSMKARRST
jgi:GMP synthase (glutamine-hydrolysing)